MDVQAEHLIRLALESQLRERDPHLRRPSVLVGRGLCGPHHVVGLVEHGLVVFRVVPVHADALRRDAEDVGRAMVEERVKRDEDVFGLLDTIASCHRRLDARARALPHPRAHIEGAVVIEKPYFGAFRRLSALDGFFLYEVGDW
jgi:hypothetical protein